MHHSRMTGHAAYWELTKRTISSFTGDNCMHLAAGIAYYAFFSMFPLILGLIAILSLFLEPLQVQQRLLDMTLQVFPASADLVAKNIQGVVVSRGRIGIISLVALLWSAMAVFSAVRISLNRAWGVKRDRPFVYQKLLEFAMIVGIGLLVLISLAGTAFLRYASEFAPEWLRILGGSQAGNLTASLLPAAVSFVIFASVFWFVPNIKATWEDIWPGALLTAVLFEVGKNLFAWYLTSFANYALIYGALAAVVALLFWAYISAVVLLLGAEFTSEYSRLMGSRHEEPLNSA